MLTKTQAVNRSIKKWEALVEDPYSAEGDCGFCAFMEQLVGAYFDEDSCQKHCPLYPDVCSLFMPDENFPIYWQFKEADDTKIKKQLASKMLKAIKERGAKWIKGEL